MKAPLYAFLMSGVFLLIDRFFKWKALYDWQTPKLIGEFIGWDPFMNKGIAFGIIIPVAFIFVLTVLIIASVIYLFVEQLKNSKTVRWNSIVGLMLIIAGALSNLADRVIYKYTVDYFRILTSVINLADVLIIVGFVLYFSSLKHLGAKENQH